MGNCVSPPAPPSIPPDHPFLGSRIHSSSHGFGFACAVSSESRPSSFGMDVGTRRGLQGWTCPKKSFGKFPAGSEAFDPRAGGREDGGSADDEGWKSKVRSSLTRQAAHFSTLNNSPQSPAQCDALGRRAAEGVPDSQPASEQGGSAKRERALRTRLASSGGQLTKRTEQGAGRAAGSRDLFRERGSCPDSGFPKGNPRHPVPGAVGQSST